MFNIFIFDEKLSQNLCLDVRIFLQLDVYENLSSLIEHYFHIEVPMSHQIIFYIC